MPIYFYSSHEEPYGCFSNFSPHGFLNNGKYWPTCEHYFQAQKFIGLPDEEEIRLSPSPKVAATRGRERRRPLRQDWEEVKDEVMRVGVLCKFTTHASIREILLATGQDEIIEASPSDYYWGCGADGSGQNKLGQMLMETRARLALRSEG